MTCLPTITSITNFKWQVFCFKFCMLQAYETLVSDLMVVFETIHCRTIHNHDTSLEVNVNDGRVTFVDFSMQHPIYHVVL